MQFIGGARPLRRCSLKEHKFYIFLMEDWDDGAQGCPPDVPTHFIQVSMKNGKRPAGRDRRARRPGPGHRSFNPRAPAGRDP